MTENPYKSPQEPENRYFTDDITLLPISAIWRTCRRQGVTGLFVLFPLFVGRKLLNLRYPANHATFRIEQIAPLADKDLSQATRDALGAIEAVCRDCGMERITVFRPPWIGNKSGVFSIWLQPGGVIHCSIVQIELRLGTFYKSKTVFACHSKLESGVELHTSALAPEDWIPELVPPDQDIERLPPTTEPFQVIERHRQRVADRSDLVRFTGETLLHEILIQSQKQFDFLVSKGIYAPISAIEVQRLKSANQGMHAIKR